MNYSYTANIYIYIYIYIYLKVAIQRGNKRVKSWFLIFFEMFSDSFVIKYKVKFCVCYTFVCLKYKGTFCDSYTVKIHLLEILRQILWLLHQRFICFNVIGKDWLIHISYNRIDRIIMAKMDYMENWNYVLFGHALLGLTLNLIK